MRFKLVKKQHLAVCISAAILTFSSGVRANATGEQVVAGQAGFERVGSNLIITQGSQRVIINWQDFSNANGELTKFIQPNSSAAALNRVISGNPSALLGDLQANGHIYLINPNGIVVGADANINTQSFIASTLDVADADFMNGGDLNFVGESQKTIENLGTINGGNGDVFLIAKHVDNSGTIKAEGHVGLAGGNDVLLKASGDDRLAVRVTDKDGRVDQKGLVEATKIELRTAGNNPYALAINHEGISRATSAVNKEGRIILFAEGGTTKADGTLDASAPESGDGGFIETSGTHVKIADTVKIDTSSKNGETGTWLIDPNDFTIAATGDISATTLATQLNNNNVTIETATQGTAGGNGDIFVNESVTSASTNNLTLNAERDINVNQSINIGGDINLNGGDGADGADGNDGTFSAAATNAADGGRGGAININASLASNTGNINVVSGSGGTGGKGGDGRDTLTAGGAPAGLSGDGGNGGNIIISASVTASNGDVEITSGSGGEGGLGGRGGLDRAAPLFLATNGGEGGKGGDAGLIAFLNDIDAGDELNIRAGDGGKGGDGGDTLLDNAALPAGSAQATGGLGGRGGVGGILSFSAASISANSIVADAGTGGDGGNGGVESFGTVSGDGGNGGSGGIVEFIQALNINGSGNYTFNSGNGGNGGTAGLGSGSDGLAGMNENVQFNNSITTNGNLIFNSAGNISGAGQLSANNITLNANAMNAAIGASGSAIQTNATGIITASANNGTGGIFLSNQGNIQLGNINSGTGDATIQTISGSISGTGLITANNVTLNANSLNASIGSATQVINTTATGTLVASANNGTGGIFLDNGGNSATVLQLQAGTGDVLYQNAASVENQSPSFILGNNVTLQNIAGAINTSNYFSFDVGTLHLNNIGGDVTIPGEFNGLALGTINLGTNNFTLTAAGSITSNSSSVTAGNLSLTASGLNTSIGTLGNAINTSLSGTLSASASGGGGIFIAETGAMNLSTLIAGVGDVELSAGGDITSSTVLQGNNISISATGTNSAIGSTGAGTIQLNAAGTVSANANDGTGGIFLSQQGDLVLGDVNSGTGDVELTASEDVLLNGQVNAGSGNVTITAVVDPFSSIQDVAGLDNDVDIIANELTLNANERIGGRVTFFDGNLNTLTFDNALNLQVNQLTASTGNDPFSSIFVNEVDDINLGSLTSQSATGFTVLTAGGDIERASGSIDTAVLALTTTGLDSSIGAVDPLRLGRSAGNAAFLDASNGSGDVNLIVTNGSLDASSINAGTGDVSLTSVASLIASQLITGNNVNLIASGSNSAIGSTGVNAIQINATGIITATASNGNGGIFLSKLGDFDISNLVLNSGTGDTELTAINGSLISGTSAFNFSGANLTLTTTEDPSNNTPGDRNIQIGSGGITASNTNFTLTSADDVIVDGAINVASLTATAGDGKFTPAPGEGERGGDIVINQSITTSVGDVNLTSGNGGSGGSQFAVSYNALASGSKGGDGGDIRC